MSNHLSNDNITTNGIEAPAPQKEPDSRREIHGLLVSYRDDQIDECVHSALRGKQRVHYKCMDVYSNFIAFGTSVGAIYLFRLTTITHASCKLSLVIPCDQGSIEVIKFLPGSLQSSELLIAMGTSRGSLVIFQLNCLDEEIVRPSELYRAEEFTKSVQESAVGIKLIEYDLDLGSDGAGYNFTPMQPQCSFSKLYICDQRERLFVLDSSSIHPAFRLLYSHKPAHVLSVDESSVNQICVCRSQLLMSTDEKTRIFREQSNELVTIGKKQRKTKGFFGACFFNPNYKPPQMRTRPAISSSQQTMYSSTNSLIEMENLLMFIARPKFSLWQVNNRREVMFTHIFDSSIRTTPSSKRIELCNIPLNSIHDDDYEDMQQVLDGEPLEPVVNGNRGEPRSDHFEKLIAIFSMTLGNLLLSYTRHEIFVIDPIGARLIVWYQHDKPITQVCCNENEIFILSEPNKRQFKIDRLLLLAPTQFILELHRINRFLSLMVFVQTFCHQMKRVMALPLDGPNTITTEGGLLRNIVWSTWRECSEPPGVDHKSSSSSSTLDGEESNDATSPQRRIDLSHFEKFKQIIDVIVYESRQLKQSIENLADSRLLFMVSNENIERLCSEPYASMVSLDINLSNLHTNQVVHFSQEALQKQKSLAKLSQSIMNLNKLKRTATEASLNHYDEPVSSQLNNSMTNIQQDTAINFNDKRVVVEQLRPKQRLQQQQPVPRVEPNTVFSLKDIQEEQTKTQVNGGELTNGEQEVQPAPTIALSLNEELVKEKVAEQIDVVDGSRCPNCRSPRPRAHLKPMHHSQQIQYNWIQENLLADLDSNVDQIQERAFKHGLWHLILKCYAFRNQWDDYIACCIMLDDVRLLNTDRFVNSKQNEDYLLDRVFEQLKLTLGSTRSGNNDEKEPESHDDDSRSTFVSKRICFKCKNELPGLDADDSDDDQYIENTYSKVHRDGEDDISFNLVNLFRKYMLRKNADVKWAVSRLLHHPDLLDRSKISANFYLQVIANQCATIRRTRLKK